MRKINDIIYIGILLVFGYQLIKWCFETGSILVISFTVIWWLVFAAILGEVL